MADLDDFFAKKDRKKNKGKKFTTTDEIAKKLEETGKKLEKSKKEKSTLPSQPSGQEGDEHGNHNQEDDEWREFEEEKKDYSGLRIGKLQITEGEGDAGEGDGEEEQVMEENEAGEMVLKKKVHAGPWKMVNTQAAQEIPEPQVVEKRPEPNNTGPSTYRPPQMRNQPKDSGHAGLRNVKSKAAPDINNEEFFPTLSASKSIEPNTGGAWGRRRRDEGTFEEVRNSKSHSSRYSDMTNKVTTGGGGPKLSLGNKYDALSQDQS